MKNYKDEIFELLGVKPFEKFKLRSQNEIYKNTYWIDDINLLLYEDGSPCAAYGLRHILAGTIEIVKKIIPTEEEILALKYAKAIGCEWIAKDDDDQIFAYNKKPYKDNRFYYWSSDEGECYQIYVPISWLSWDDKEPTNIQEILEKGEVF